MKQNQLSIGDQLLTLNRAPHFDHQPLRAWDAADAYLLSLVPDSATDLTVVNDSFGALTLALRDRIQQSWSDSALLKSALKKNAKENNLNSVYTLEKVIDLTNDPEAPISTILLKIPKSNRLLEWQLSKLSSLSPKGTELWLAGMDKHITKNQFELVAKYFGDVTALRGVKKARVWQAVNSKPGIVSEFFSPAYTLPGSDFNLIATPGVYSGENLDPGSRFFLENIHKLSSSERVLDLGCGNGVLSLAYHLRFPEAALTLTDESSHGVACARENFKRLDSDFKDIDFVQTEATNGLKEDYFSMVICNPPFHQGTTINTQLGQYFFKAAKKVLKRDGELWIVANRHLNYQATLKHLFGNCVMRAQNDKFVVLSARN